MKALEKVNDVLCVVLRAACLVLALAFTVVVLFQVAARNWILISVPWTDEIALILFVWSVLLGAAIGVRKRIHYVVDLFPKSKVRLNLVLDILAGLLMFAMILVFLWAGSVFAKMGLRRNFTSIIVTQSWLFVAMPIAAGCMTLFTIENLAKDLVKLRDAVKNGVPEVLTADDDLTTLAAKGGN